MVKKKSTMFWIVLVTVIIISFLGGCVEQVETCRPTEMDNGCTGGLICNTGYNVEPKGVCNTVEQCIASGSYAGAVEGSDICFPGV